VVKGLQGLACLACIEVGAVHACWMQWGLCTTSVPITSRIATILASMAVGGQLAFAVEEANQSSQCYEMYRAAKSMPYMLPVQC